MKLKTFKSGDFLNHFKSANKEMWGGYATSYIFREWEKIIKDENIVDKETAYQVLSDFFKYDATKAIITSNKSNVGKREDVCKELSVLKRKKRNSKAYSLSQSLLGWISTTILAGSLGVLGGGLILNRLKFYNAEDDLLVAFANSPASEYVSALNELEDEMLGDLLTRFASGGIVIVGLCFAMYGTYKLFSYPIDDKTNDLESAKAVLERISSVIESPDFL